MRSLALTLLLMVVAVAAQRNNGQTSGEFLAMPERSFCENRPKHWNFNGHNYFFSFDIPEGRDKVNWLKARNICRKRCMDAVGIESEAENKMIFDFIRNRNITYIWTSGRLCDFTGCAERQDLKPLKINGWFWSDTNTKMAPTNVAPTGWGYQPWSNNGHTGAPQPDNAEFDINNTTESCMGVLNNLYKDGIKWHDIACYHKKPVICEDNDLLLNFVFQNGRRQ